MLKNEVIKAIVQGSYRAFKEKEKNNDTKTATINKLVKMIEKEIKDAN